MVSDPSSALVRFAGVAKTYDGTSFAVRDLDLDVRRGEFLTLLGPSGSGKTTTLMMLAGFEAPSAGDILLDGRSIRATPAHRRNFGMVFQSYALFPHLSVGDNVAYPLSVRGVSGQERQDRVARALAMVRLEGYETRRPSQLSGGQQQRVALARALVFEPTLVLMDEPLGALDKQLREHMQIEIKHIHERLGVTVVYVTHDQGEALTLSDRVAVFQDGALQQVAPVDRLYEVPANRFVAGFVGDATFLQGRLVSRHGGAAELELPGGRRLRGVDGDLGDASPGTDVVAMVRPERITLTSEPAGANALSATVEDVIYFGDHLRARCAIDGQAVATVKLPLGPRPPVGGAVTLHLPADHLRMYR